MTEQTFDKKSGLAFIIAFGFVSLFADMAYEGMRSSTGPFLSQLGASATAVGIIAGAGELFGYLLRLLSARLVERTRAYWLVTLAGYAIQMAAVPLLALAGNWWMAAALIILERTGKAVRTPAASTMKSKAGEQIGQGWAFGLHEAMDQTGALAGPLIAAFVLAHHGNYREAFLWLGVPATLTILTVIAVSARFNYAGNIAAAPKNMTGRLPPAFWWYAGAAALIGFGFADYPLIAYHYEKAKVVSDTAIPIFYAAAMGASGAGSLIFGRWFDASGLRVLIVGVLIGAAVAPLVFFGGFALALLGTILWGVALGIHDAIMTAAISTMVPEHARARAFALFSAIYGIAWFIGSAAMGALYDVSYGAMVALAVVAELTALAPLLVAIRRAR
jgi:predicted MFS family arabinose efflux permease